MGDILSATALLLTLVGLLYSVWYRELSDALDTKVPEFPEDRKRPLRHVHGVLVTKALPLAALSLGLTLAFLPVAVSITAVSLRLFLARPSSYFRSYDPVSTAFILVILVSVFFSNHLVAVLIRLYLLRRRLASR